MSETQDGSKVSINVEGIGGVSKAESSTQLPERRINSMGKGVKPPYNPDRLAAFIELNETLATGIRKKARYEVGYGFEVAPHRDADEPPTGENTDHETIRDFWRGLDSRWQTKARQSAEPATPEEVLELARQDFHLIGWCCLEILVDLEGEPIGLAHVPARTVRVRKPQNRFDQPRHPEDGTFADGENADLASRGYVQGRNGRRRYFGEAGDRYRGRDDENREPVFVDKETGEVAVGRADALDNPPANELIFVTNPSPLEDDYGVPDWVSGIRTITADEAAKDYNREFFDNDTIPRFVIKVIGGELSEESKRDLKQMLNGLREESHRTIILEVEKFLDSDIDEDVEIELKPLSQGISEEMDFKAFREKNEAEIAKVLEVPPIKIGNTGTSNRSNSEQQDRDFALEVIKPEQHKFAERLYQTIHQQAFGVRDWTIEFALRGADQPETEARLTEQKVRSMRLSGVVTVDELRAEQDLEPLGPPEGDMTLTEFEAEFAGGGGDGGDETEASLRSIDEPPAENKIGERDWAAVKPQLISKDPIETQQFNSSNLDEGLFDFGENDLFISFLREEGQSSLYAYTDVPTSEWSGLVNAGSAGSYHYSEIRLEYPYVEITNFHDRLPEGEMPDDPPEGVPT